MDFVGLSMVERREQELRRKKYRAEEVWQRRQANLKVKAEALDEEMRMLGIFCRGWTSKTKRDVKTNTTKDMREST